jgi:hypothetical protein
MAGRLVEEISQVSRDGVRVYWSRFWNKVDVLLLAVQGTAFFLGVFVDYLLYSGGDVKDGDGTMGAWNNMTTNSSVESRQLSGRLGSNQPEIDPLYTELQQIRFDFQVSAKRRDHDRVGAPDALALHAVWQAWGMLLFVFRSTEIVNHHPAMGRVFLILREMIYDSFPVTVYMLVAATSAGLAFGAGIPPVDPQVGRPHLEAKHVGLAGFWAILGSARCGGSHAADARVATVPQTATERANSALLIGPLPVLPLLVRSELEYYDDFYSQSTPLRNQFNSRAHTVHALSVALVHSSHSLTVLHYMWCRFNWMPLLLYLTSFLTTIYMVNLLIAMMTATYEKIRTESHYWCRAASHHAPPPSQHRRFLGVP